MRHIDEFTIHRFRGIRELKLEGLGQINLLVGNNNSGKSSVLEALSLFSDPLNMSRWYEVAFTREASQNFNSDLMINNLIWVFPQEAEGDEASSQSRREISICGLQQPSLQTSVSASYEHFTETTIVKYYDALRPGIFEEREQEIKGVKVHVSLSGSYLETVFPDAHGEIKETFEFANHRTTLSNDRKSSFMLASQLITPFSHRLSGLSPLLWSGVVESDMKSDVLKLLTFFDRNIQDVDIIAQVALQPTISIKHKKLKRAPLNTFGDGLRRIFTLAAAIPRAKGGLLLVDELETAIHTKVLSESFRWLIHACMQNDIQLFATTHSLETVDAIISVCSDEPVDLVGYRLEADEKQTDVTRLDKGLITRLRENLGMEIR